MFNRFVTGDFNATTTILVALFLNIIAAFAAIFMLPVLGVFGLFLFGAILYGLVAAARNPVQTGFGRFMCWLFAAIQTCLIVSLAIAILS